MPRQNPDGPARHQALQTAFDLAHARYDLYGEPLQPSKVQHIETTGVNQARTATTATADPLHDAEQIPSENWCLSPVEESFRHGFWRARRSRIAAALAEAQTTTRRQANFLNCGANSMIWQSPETGELECRCIKCRDRFCLPCQQERARRLQAALARRVPLAKCLFVVLTLQSSDAPLGDQMSTLYKAASKMRQRPFWRENVTGGFQCFECTWSEDRKQWHPHLHLLVHSEWLDQAKLSAEWKRATATSSVVHVTLVQNTPAGIAECTKYLAQPVHRSIQFVPERLVELIKALHGRRLCTTFGTWRSDPLLTDDREDDPRTWLPITTLAGLVAQAARRDEWSMHALRFLESRRPGRTAVVPPPVRDTS